MKLNSTDLSLPNETTLKLFEQYQHAFIFLHPHTNKQTFDEVKKNTLQNFSTEPLSTTESK